MLETWLRTVLLLGAIPGLCFANWNDTPTGIDLNQLPHFQLAKVRSGWLKYGARVVFDGITATAAPGGVWLRGAGKSGKRWQARVAGLDEVWKADLDGNGTEDYVLSNGGPYFNGRITPCNSISVLLMDRDGLPVPFFTTIYFGDNGEGIKHLVNLQHDGHAEIIIRSYDEIPSDPWAQGFCSGHWVSQLYRFDNLAADEIRGTFGGTAFPLVFPWSDPHSECSPLENPRPLREQVKIYDHGTGRRPLVRTGIRRIESEPVPGGLLEVENVPGCKWINAAVVVYDTLRMREISFPNLFDDYSVRLPKEILHAHAGVELRGLTKGTNPDYCPVNLLWAGRRGGQ